MSKSQESGTVFGVGWYRPEQWALLLSESVDRDKLEPTHAEWLSSAESSLKIIRAEGHNPVKVDIDVEELIAWSKAKGMTLDGNARALFIADKTRQKDQEGK